MLFRTHKKGFVTSTLVDMFSFLAFALIVVIFFLMFKFKAEGTTSTLSTAEEIHGLDTNMILLNYLRSTTTLNGEEITIADLFVKYKLGEIERSVLEAEIKKFVDKLDEFYRGKTISFGFVVYNKERIPDLTYNYISQYSKRDFTEIATIAVSEDKFIEVGLIMHYGFETSSLTYGP